MTDWGCPRMIEFSTLLRPGEVSLPIFHTNNTQLIEGICEKWQGRCRSAGFSEATSVYQVGFSEI